MSAENDWMNVLRQHVDEAPLEIDLTRLLPGDLLRVVTLHTTYDLEIIAGRIAELKCDRADRPSGRVQIQGCTFGRSATIKPDALFSGGNLEFTFDDGAMTHTTTVIRELHWLRRNAQPTSVS